MGMIADALKATAKNTITSGYQKVSSVLPFLPQVEKSKAQETSEQIQAGINEKFESAPLIFRLGARFLIAPMVGNLGFKMVEDQEITEAIVKKGVYFVVRDKRLVGLLGDQIQASEPMGVERDDINEGMTSEELEELTKEATIRFSLIGNKGRDAVAELTFLEDVVKELKVVVDGGRSFVVSTDETEGQGEGKVMGRGAREKRGENWRKRGGGEGFIETEFTEKEK